MATQPIVKAEGVVRSTRDLTTVRDGRQQVFAVAVELLTEVGPLSGGFLEVTCFIRDGELLPSMTPGEIVSWAVALEVNTFRGRSEIRAQFVSEIASHEIRADLPPHVRLAAADAPLDPNDPKLAAAAASLAGKGAAKS